MIEKVTLRDFQSHKFTELELSSGVNVFTGPSRNGKSAIIRSIIWALYNTPRGDSFVSWWSKKTSATIEFTDDVTVTRLRTPSKNMYKLNGKPFTSFGNEVPLAITSRIAMSDLNIQSQHDNAFLLSESSAEVSRVLNRLANLELIDFSLSTSNKKIRKEQRKLQQLQEQLQEAKRKKEYYEGMDILERHIKGMRDYANRHKLLSQEVKTLEAIVDVADKANNKLNKLQWISSSVSLLKATNEKCKQYQRLCIDVVKLDNLIGDAVVHTNAIMETTKIVKAQSKLNQIQDTVSIYSDLQKEASFLKQLIGKYEVVEEMIKNKKEKILELKQRKEEIKPEECPICGTPKSEWRK